ncbi:phosphatase PAP2 family protein [Roseateles sp. DAIF2]|uniref:phosphatase PAP2 family protein n=1 Tax=Roseateles sp. DAIF2 TaxID=2714952 RepID=UPI0018A33917|nr:phosphatase PAP2 family protein [Roseateles sp. DAIF2]QPF73927.1 phosphatase PAP2 family protein [Roseateles sp. DAIF2]
MNDPLIAAADWVGRHAPLLYLAGLGLLLPGVAALALPLRRLLGPPLPEGAARPLWPMILAGAAGFLLLLGAAGLFAEIAERLGPSGRLARIDEALTRAIAAHTELAWLRAFALLTHLGDVLTLSLLGVGMTLLLCWRGERALAFAWVLAMGGNALLNPALKQVFQRVRPLHEHGLVSESGWSFPSGHSSSATVAYGMLAYLALRLLPRRWHLPALLAAAAAIFTVGCSRVFLQVHFASDVLAGFASGLAWLCVSLLSVALARRAWRHRGWLSSRRTARSGPG